MPEQNRKSAYVYDQDVFRPGALFCRPHTIAWFGRIHSGGALEFCHQVRWNNWGFRDDAPYGPRRTARELRIAVLGDSFVSNLDSEAAWPNLADGLLKARLGPEIRVFNLGLPGVGPANWMAMEHLVRALAPDLIVAACYDGILKRPAIQFVTDVPRRRFVCRYGYPLHSARPIGLYDPAFRTRCAEERAAAVQALNHAQRAAGPTTWSHVRTWLDRRWMNGQTIGELNASRLRRILRWAPAAMVVGCPSQARFTGEILDDDSSQALERVAVAERVPLVDLYAELQGRSPEQLYTASSGHWSRSGNQAVAERLADHWEAWARARWTGAAMREATPSIHVDGAPVRAAGQ